MSVRIVFVLSHQQFACPALLELDSAAEEAGLDHVPLLLTRRVLAYLRDDLEPVTARVRGSLDQMRRRELSDAG